MGTIYYGHNNSLISCCRYDFDSSGTINNFDELKQLTYNLVYTLKMEQRSKDIEALIDAFGDVERNPLDVEQYFRIFEQNFMTN